MHRHVAVTLLMLTACGGPQPTPVTGEPTPAPDAAPTPVVVVPPDAAPPPAPPPPPEVPAQTKRSDVAELRTAIKAESDERKRTVLFGQLAEALWAQTCKQPVDGLCVAEVARKGKKKKPAPPTCDGRTTDLVATARAAKKITEVQQVIGEVRQGWGDGAGLAPIIDPNAEVDAYVLNTYLAEEVAASLLILAHHEHERLIALPPLTGLVFDPDSEAAMKRSSKRLEEWFQELQKRAKDTVTAYARLFDDRELLKWAPEAAVEAAARIAQVQYRVAVTIRGLEVPKEAAKDLELQNAFCGTLAEKAAPVDDSATESAQACAGLANELGVIGGWADRCAVGP